MRAMDDLIGFIFDLALEHDGGENDWDQHKCPIMTANEDRLGDIKVMIAEIINPMTTIKWDADTETIMFNDQDITDEIMLMVGAFDQEDAKKMGFIFGDTLDKHSKNPKMKPKFI